MNRYEKATAYHHQGFNCCQSVLAAYTDLTGLTEQASFDLGGGFGAGAQTGRAVRRHHRAIMTLGMITPVNPEDPVGSKRRTRRPGQGVPGPVPGEVRGGPLPPPAEGGHPRRRQHPVARDMGLTNRCDVMIITAMEIVEEIRAQQA